MAAVRSETDYVCEECGADYSKWSGQCLRCKAWNSIREIPLQAKNPQTKSRIPGYAGSAGAVRSLSEVGAEEVSRIQSGMREFDRVLGGGFVPGSVILLSGDPGAGKSTILIQILAHAASSRRVLYVSGEGTRPLLVEIQALVVESQHGNPRRLGVGIDQNRIAMLLAVLFRHGGVLTSDYDVFLNCVGGIRVTETSADLAIVLGVVSSLKNAVIAHQVFVFGEIGLSGEIRPVANGEARINEAFKHGFKKAIVPKSNVPKKHPPGMEMIGVSRLSDAIAAM